jgi:AcrR family transcriptional regulator
MRKGETTRQRIIEKSAPIFNQKGFAGSSMQDVMEATGLEKGGLYRHFSGKEELAAEVFRYTVARAEKLRSEKIDPAQAFCSDRAVRLGSGPEKYGSSPIESTPDDEEDD